MYEKYFKTFRMATPAMQKLFARGLFKNKVNLVTGGGTGIGFGTAAGLAQLGSKVPSKISTYNFFNI